MIDSTEEPDVEQHHRGRRTGLGERDARLLLREHVAEERGDRRERAGGDREPQDARHEAGPRPFVVRREREEERRDADRQRRDERQLPREERELEPDHPDADREQERVDRLGHEQVRHPLDVAEHPAALAHDGRQRRRSCRPAARVWATARVAAEPEPIATPMSASFRASTSFTPSPVIATTWPRDWSASTIARFCCGVTRPKTRVVSRTSASSSRSSGRSPRVDGASAPGRPSAPRDRGDGGRVVAGDDLDVDALPGEVGERVGAVRRTRSVQDDEGDRDEPLAAAVGRRGRVGAGEQEHAQSPSACARVVARRGRRRRASSTSGAPSTQSAALPEVGAAPLAGGRERDGRRAASHPSGASG